MLLFPITCNSFRFYTTRLDDDRFSLFLFFLSLLTFKESVQIVICRFFIPRIKFDYLIQQGCSAAMKAAAFSHTLAQQVANFKNFGFILVKCPPLQQKSELIVMEKGILCHYNDIKDTFTYRLWRNFNYVSTSTKRHSIPLPLSFMGKVDGTTLPEESVVRCTISHILPFLKTQLRSHSPLVEFSTVIALSGAEKQESHTDVPFSKNNFVISAFVALTPVELENGATCVFSGSHTEVAHQRFMRPSTQLYNADGSADVVFVGDEAPGGKWEGGADGYQPQDTLEDCSSFPEEAAVLEPGDILLFNTQLAHYGGANVCPSKRPRALLSFSFQNVDNENDNVNNDYSPDCSLQDDGNVIEHAKDASKPSNTDNAVQTRSASEEYDKIPEFTYHCDRSVTVKNFTLNDFK